MVTQAARPRQDVVRNRRRILEAAGELLREDPASVSIAQIAQRTGISVPTVYRHFATAEVLVNSYLLEVVVQLRNYSHDATDSGMALFDSVLDEWGRLLSVYGEAMVLLRSREGFLARLRAGEELICAVRDAWERPIRAVLRQRALDDANFEPALFLLNMMFDPREVLDLCHAGWSTPQALAQLRAAWLAAVAAWAGGLPAAAANKTQ